MLKLRSDDIIVAIILFIVFYYHCHVHRFVYPNLDTVILHTCFSLLQ